MPSQRKRIGFLPSEEVHEIIEKLCIANQFSQSKVTGILVEEALRSRGVLGNKLSTKKVENDPLFNESFEQELLFTDKKIPINKDDYKVNKKLLSDDIKIMHEFIEFKYFKKVMKQNDNIFN